MRKLNNLLVCTYFQSASHETQQFKDFYKEFCRLFTNELKKIKATDIQINKGHFYAYGFFKVGETILYFSIPDVRENSTELLIRTAKSYSDFTGGQNNYIDMNIGMAKAIAKRFGLEYFEPKKRTAPIVDNDKLFEALEKNGTIELKVASCKKASTLAWRLTEKLGKSFRGITYHRLGRSYLRVFAENEVAEFDYNPSNKTFRLTLQEAKEQIFLNTLQKYDKGENVENPYSKETCFLNAEQLALYDFIKGAELTRHSKFQYALSIFIRKYPNEYMILLD